MFDIKQEIDRANAALGIVPAAKVPVERYAAVYPVGDRKITVECTSLYNAQQIARWNHGEAIVFYR